jgi:hypothetical protein
MSSNRYAPPNLPRYKVQFRINLFRAIIIFIIGLVFWALAIASFFPKNAKAVTKTVGIDFTCDRAGLQAAMNSADLVVFNCPSPTIIVDAELFVNNPLTIDGNNNGNSIILQGNGNHRILRSQNPFTFKIQNIKLQNGGRAADLGCQIAGVKANDGYYGGAIFKDSGKLEVENVTFMSNTVTGGAGALICQQGGDASGGAIYTINTNVSINNSTFSNNKASGGNAYNPSTNFGGQAYGGAIAVNGSSVVMTNTVFTGNVAKSGDNPGQTQGAYATGGGLFCSGCFAILTNVNFEDNIAQGGLTDGSGDGAQASGGAISIGNNGPNAPTLNIFNSDFEENNTANARLSYGGAIHVDSGIASIINTDFEDNSVYDFGGAISNFGNTTILNSEFNGNSTSNSGFGGAIANGDTITIRSARGTTKGNILSNNTSGTGGAFVNFRGASATIENTTIISNSASVAGGGISANTVISVSRSLISGNTAVEGGGIFIGTYDTEASIINSTISGNTATGGFGGAASVYEPGSTSVALRFYNSTVTANNGTNVSGVYNDAGVVSATNTIFANNALSNCSSINGGTFNNGRSNIDNGSTCGFGNIDGSISNTNPLLDSLKSNGGPTKTHALLATSPAIDKGSSSACAVATTVNNIDQRGFTRISIVAGANVGTTCDIGAYEYTIESNTSAPSNVNFSGTQLHQSPVLNSYPGLDFQSCFQFWDWTLNDETIPLKSPGAGQPGYGVTSAKAAGITSESPTFECKIKKTSGGGSLAPADNGKPLDFSEAEIWAFSIGTPAPVTVEGLNSSGGVVASQNVAANYNQGQTTQVTLQGVGIVEIKVTPNFSALPPGTPTRCDLSSNPLFNYCVVIENLTLTPVPNNSLSGFVLLPATVRLFANDPNNPLSAVGETPANPPSSSSTVLPFGGKGGIPADAKGVIGVITAISCTGGGNLRFWTGTTVPNTANLNIPGAIPLPVKPNMSTSFITPLDANGNVNLGLGAAAGVKCGFIIDAVGYVANNNLLAQTYRLAFKVNQNEFLTAVGGTPANPPSTSSVSLKVAGAGGVPGIPANAKGAIGVLTAVNCTGGGNLRFWTGATVPNAANLNIPGAVPGTPKPNFSTSFITPLDANGSVNLGLGSAVGVKCGYVVDIVGWIDSDILLPANFRLIQVTNPLQGLISQGATPVNPGSSSSVSLQVAGTGGVPGVPANAKGVVGIVTAINCSAGGNFRFWTGTAIPNAANLNIPDGVPVTPKPNVSTSFITSLDANGKFNLGLGSSPGVQCGYQIDIVGFIN